MTLTTDPVMLASSIGMGMLCAALLLLLYRLIAGPSSSDRVLAMDTVGTVLVAMLSLHAVAIGQAALLRVAAVLALINFVGTIAFADRIRRRAGA